MFSRMIVFRRIVGRFGIFFLSLSAFFGTGPAFGQAAGQWKDADQMYDRVCSYCHEKNVGPRILGRKISEEFLTYVVQNGLRAMPAFRPTDFSSAELVALAKFVHESKAGDVSKDK